MNKNIPQMEFKVLDHGYVRLIDYMGDDDAACESARLSTDNPTGVDPKKDDALRDRLWRDAHSSVFESMEAVIESKQPLYVARQLDRHRTIDYASDEGEVELTTVDGIARKFTSRNEFSGRYSVFKDEFYIPSNDRIQGKNSLNKQGSGALLDDVTRQFGVETIVATTDSIGRNYKELIEAGVSNEVARSLLSVNVYTKIRLKACLLNWLKMLNLRLREDVQWETRQYAQAMAKIIRTLFPKCWAVFEEHTLYGTTLSRSEFKALKGILEGTLSSPDAESKLVALGLSDKAARRLLGKLSCGEVDLVGA